MFERILVPVDGSPTSNKALVLALQTATDGPTHSRVRLVHVVDEMAFVSGFDTYGGYSAEFLRAMREYGAKVIADAMAIVGAAGVQGDHLMFDNFGLRLGEVVATAATDWSADLIVVGTHGRRGVGRAFLGSGAEQVIRLAPVPVLVVRSSET